MIAYVDSSVLLRFLLKQKNALAEWKSITVGVSSALIQVECMRAIERCRLAPNADLDELAETQRLANDALVNMKIANLDAVVLRHAAHPMGVPLGSLDAIHLATAILWRERNGPDDLVFATHDRELARAAIRFQFQVIGVQQP